MNRRIPFYFYLMVFTYFLGGLLLPRFAFPQNTNSASLRPMAVVFFEGGMGEVLSEIGPDLVRFNHELHQSLGTQIGAPGRLRPPWGKVALWTQVTSICRELGGLNAQYRIVIVGHSYGAHAAVAASRCLGETFRRNVDLLITLDTITNPGSSGDASLISSNVRSNFNFFQNDDLILRGVTTNRRDNGAFTDIHNRGMSFFSLSPHSALDNRALPLVQWIMSKEMLNQTRCIYIPGESQDPTRGPFLNSRQLDERAPFDSLFLNNSCRLQ